MACIMLVDNERDTIDIVSLAIRMLGHEPVGVGSGRRAVEVIAEQRPDLVMVDYMMPDWDGIETLENIRRLPGGEDLPVVLSTASADKHIQQQFLDLGGDAVVEKPIDLATLEALVVRFTGVPAKEPSFQKSLAA